MEKPRHQGITIKDVLNLLNPSWPSLDRKEDLATQTQRACLSWGCFVIAAGVAAGIGLCAVGPAAGHIFGR